ncbi:unnamed protein product [Gadus morhua 'NCC']
MSEAVLGIPSVPEGVCLWEHEAAAVGPAPQECLLFLPRSATWAGGVEAGGVEAGGVEAGGVEAGGVEAGGVEAGGVEAGPPVALAVLGPRCSVPAAALRNRSRRGAGGPGEQRGRGPAPHVRGPRAPGANGFPFTASPPGSLNNTTHPTLPPILSDRNPPPP